MSIIDGAVNSLGSAFDGLTGALGLDWVSGSVLGAISPVVITLTVPEDYPSPSGPFPGYHTGHLTLNVPNNSAEFGTIAINMAQNALVMIELAVALQTIINPQGGVNVKDQLDPYHYKVITDALTENGETIPPVSKPKSTTINKLGDTITEYGLLSGLANVADTLGTVSETFAFLKFSPLVTTTVSAIAPGTTGTPFDRSGITGSVVGGFPDYKLPLMIMNSAIVVQGIIMQYAVANFRNAIDTEAKALLIKNTMADFTKAVSDQAITNANNTPPEWEEPTGTPGIAG